MTAQQRDKIFHVVLVDHGIRDSLRGRRYLTVSELKLLLSDVASALPNGVAMLRIDEVTPANASNNDDGD